MTTDLAILGGTPAFASPLHVGTPNVGNRAALMTRIEDALDRRWLTNNGPFVQEFETRIAEKVRVRNCIAVANATVGLELAIRALGMAGEVIAPSFTFIATVHALQWNGIRVVFGDIDPSTHNLDPGHVAKLITPQTTGILATHVWGRPCDITPLQDLADRHGLKLLFDAAHAFGCSSESQPIGGFGHAEVFSFHATKFVNCAEGGAITTNDDELAKQLRFMRNFGFADYDRVERLGTNGKMSELSAAMGLTSLDAMDEFIAINRRHHAQYRQRLASIRGISLVSYDSQPAQNYQYVVAIVDPTEFGLSRDELVQVLHAEQVLARRYFFPGCHAHEPYRTLAPRIGRSLPHTEALCQRVMLLPTGTAIQPGDINRIGELMESASTQAERVRAVLQSSCRSTCCPVARNP